MRAKKKQTILSEKVCCFHWKTKTKQNKKKRQIIVPECSCSLLAPLLAVQAVSHNLWYTQDIKRLKASVSLATGGGQYRPLTLLWNDSKQNNKFWAHETPMHDKHPKYRKGHVSYWSDERIKFSVLFSGCIWKSNNWSILIYTSPVTRL